MSLNGPASPTKLTARILGFTSATAVTYTHISAYETYQTNVVSAGTTLTVFEIIGVLINGANAGTLTVRFKSEVAGSAITIHQGSWGEWF